MLYLDIIFISINTKEIYSRVLWFYAFAAPNPWLFEKFIRRWLRIKTRGNRRSINYKLMQKKLLPLMIIDIIVSVFPIFKFGIHWRLDWIENLLCCRKEKIFLYKFGIHDHRNYSFSRWLSGIILVDSRESQGECRHVIRL